MPDTREVELASIIRDTLWMACRYAHGRQSYAVSMYNSAARRAIYLNVAQAASGEPLFAIDGSMSREMSGLTSEEYDGALAGWSKADAIPQHCREDWPARTPDPRVAELVEAARKMLPTNVCLSNPRWPDETLVPLEVTLGELREFSAAIEKATGERR